MLCLNIKVPYDKKYTKLNKCNLCEGVEHYVVHLVLTVQLSPCLTALTWRCTEKLPRMQLVHS
jgi:hypothetical protein